MQTPIKDYFYYSISGTFGIILGMMVTFPVLLIPQHNVMEHPDFWFEFMLISSIGWCGTLCATFVLNCSYWMNIMFIRTWKFFFFLFGVSILTSLVVHTFAYVTWTHALQYNLPVPYGGCVVLIITINIIYL